jgi:hypothetical protein
MTTERVTARYFLHVNDDGVEETYDFNPHSPPTKIVEVIELASGEIVEQTYTRRDEAKSPPMGKGWAFCGECKEDADFFVWRRLK